ncbi:MAG: hypothetical protein ACFFCM_05670, partial [Promethearchaeota archaeon]
DFFIYYNLLKRGQSNIYFLFMLMLFIIILAATLKLGIQYNNKTTEEKLKILSYMIIPGISIILIILASITISPEIDIFYITGYYFSKNLIYIDKISNVFIGISLILMGISFIAIMDVRYPQLFGDLKGKIRGKIPEVRKKEELYYPEKPLEPEVEQIERKEGAPLEIINMLDEIRNEIKKNQWSVVIEDLESLKSMFKEKKNKLGLKIVNAYNNYLEGIELIGVLNQKKAIKKFNTALKSFPEMGFEIERFKTYANLGILYKQQENEKKAFNNIINSWKCFIRSDKEQFQKWGDYQLQKYIIKETYLFRDKIKEIDQIIPLFEEKLSTLNKETDKNEYESIQAEFILTLINNKEFDKLFDYFSTEGIHIDDYINQFEPIISDFNKEPSIELSLVIIKLFSLKWILTTTKIMIDTWKGEIFTELYKLFFNKRIEIIERKELQPIVDFVLGSTEGTQNFIIDISPSITNLLKSPFSESSLEFISNVKNAFQNSGNHTAAEIIETWYQIIYLLRSKTPEQKSIFKDFILIFEKVFSDFFTISMVENQLSLLESFFNILIDSNDFKTDFDVCQTFSDFIINLENLFEKHLDPENRILLPKYIELLKQKYYLRAWEYNSIPGSFKLQGSIDLKYKQFLIDKLYPIRTQIENEVLIIALLEEKLSVVNKEINKLEYEELEQEISRKKDSLIMSLLTEDKNYEAAIKFIENFNCPLDNYLTYFQPFYNKVMKKPNIENMESLLKLFSLKCTDPQMMGKIGEWRNELSPRIYTFYYNNKNLIIEQGKYKQIIHFILNFTEDFKFFFDDLFNSARMLLTNPHDKKIMAFLLFVNETLQDTRKKWHAEVIHSWIQTTLQLRKVSNRDSREFFNILLKAFKTEKDHFIPLTLLEIYYKEDFKHLSSIPSIASINRFSDFLDELRTHIYSSSDFPNKDHVLNLIYQYNNNLAVSYSEIITTRMRNQTIDTIQAFGRNAVPMVTSYIMRDISRNNPAPISRALIILINKWRTLPDLEKTNFLGYQMQTIKLKPHFWFGVFELILAHHYGEYYRRLTKNENVHRKNILEIVEAYLTLFYEFIQLPEITISYSENRENTIKYLKKMNEQNQFSDDEIRAVIDNTKWSRDSKYMLKKIIEEKNFCLYCSYNMPPNSKKCPNCGKEVKEISPDEPSIDFRAMGDFFGS